MLQYHYRKNNTRGELMKKYEKPNAELTFFAVEDLTLTSPLPPGEGDYVDGPFLTGPIADLYEAYSVAEGSNAYTNVFAVEW